MRGGRVGRLGAGVARCIGGVEFWIGHVNSGHLNRKVQRHLGRLYVSAGRRAMMAGVDVSKFKHLLSKQPWNQVQSVPPAEWDCGFCATHVASDRGWYPYILPAG
jgi:hypothetical protein